MATQPKADPRGTYLGDYRGAQMFERGGWFCGYLNGKQVAYSNVHAYAQTEVDEAIAWAEARA